MNIGGRMIRTPDGKTTVLDANQTFTSVSFDSRRFRFPCELNEFLKGIRLVSLIGCGMFWVSINPANGLIRIRRFSHTPGPFGIKLKPRSCGGLLFTHGCINRATSRVNIALPRSRMAGCVWRQDSESVVRGVLPPIVQPSFKSWCGIVH